MPTLPQRAPKRTETPEQLAALAAEIRELVASLDRFYRRCDQLSKPIYMTGWTRPISLVGALARGLEHWAETIDAEAAKPL